MISADNTGVKKLYHAQSRRPNRSFPACALQPNLVMTKMPRPLIAVFATVGVLFAIVFGAIFWIQSESGKQWLARRIESATGRTVAINGPLRIHPSLLHPGVSVEGFTFGNAEWSKDRNMADIGRASVRVDLLPLFRLHLGFHEVVLENARIVIEKNAQGVGNWRLASPDKQSESDEPPELPEIRTLVIDRTAVVYRDPAIKTDMTTEVVMRSDETNPTGSLRISSRGRFKGMQGSVDGTGDSLLSLRTADNPYHLKLRATFGETTATIDGALLDPLHLKGEDLNFTLEGKDLEQMYPIAGVPLPPTPPYKLSGHLNHVGDVWTFKKFSGKLGHSDLAGDFRVDREKKPQLITANLVSRNIDMADLGGFVGANRGGAPTPRPSDRVLPQEPYNLEKLNSANAEVKFRGEHVITENLPLENMTAMLVLKDGVLTLNPLDFGVAGGTIASKVSMDARRAPIKSRLEATLKQVRLEKMFPSLKIEKMNAGVLGGRIDIASSGNSLASMFGTADGSAAILMEGGSVSELVVRLTNLDIAHSLTILLTGDKQVPVRCMVGDFKATKGDFAIQTLVLDTERASVHGQGTVNLAEETMDLRLSSKPKDFSLAALRGPIAITGSFKHPTIRPELGPVVARGAVAIALGAVTAGVGALLPLIDPGRKHESPCNALMQDAKQQSADTKRENDAKRPQTAATAR